MAMQKEMPQLVPDAKREVNEFEVPEGIAASYNGVPVRSIGLISLRASEEAKAHKRAAGVAVRLAYELAKQSLYEVNGQRVSLEDGSADTAFSDMGPVVRSLILQAYAEIHTPEEDATASFLGSRKRKVQ